MDAVLSPDLAKLMFGVMEKLQYINDTGIPPSGINCYFSVCPVEKTGTDQSIQLSIFKHLESELYRRNVCS